MKYVDTCSQYKTETYEAAGKDITLFWLTFQKHWSTSVVEISCSKSFGEFQENLRQWHLVLPKLQLSSLLIYCDCTGLRKFFYKFLFQHLLHLLSLLPIASTFCYTHRNLKSRLLKRLSIRLIKYIFQWSWLKYL